MVLGAPLAPRIVGAMSFGHAIVLGPAFSVAAALVVMAATLRCWALAALPFFLFGFGPIIWTITSTTLRQTGVFHPLVMIGG